MKVWIFSTSSCRAMFLCQHLQTTRLGRLLLSSLRRGRIELLVCNALFPQPFLESFVSNGMVGSWWLLPHPNPDPPEGDHHRKGACHRAPAKTSTPTPSSPNQQGPAQAKRPANWNPNPPETNIYSQTHQHLLRLGTRVLQKACRKGPRPSRDHGAV